MQANRKNASIHNLYLENDAEGFYYFKDNKLFKGNYKSEGNQELTCIAENVSSVVGYPDEKVYNNDPNYHIPVFYGYISDNNLYILSENGAPDIAHNNIYISLIIPYNEGIIIFAKSEQYLDTMDLYYMKKGSSPELIATDVVYDGLRKFFLKKYFPYAKYSSQNPDKFELYLYDGEKSIKMSDDYPAKPVDIEEFYK